MDKPVTREFIRQFRVIRDAGFYTVMYNQSVISSGGEKHARGLCDALNDAHEKFYKETYPGEFT